MNKQMARLLEQHFDTAFAAPDGIAKLRELILTLAMQGRLVEQDPSDPPASELLKRIEKEKTARDGKNKRKGEKKIPPIKSDEMPHQLPQGWKWVRLGEIAEINGGFAFKSSKYSDDGVRVIRISDFNERGFRNDKIVRYPYSDDLSGFSLEPNNILMAMTGGTVGKSLLVKVLPELMFINQRVATIKLSKEIVPEFINGLIRTDLIQSVIQKSKNSTNDNISMGAITRFFVPLPPASEQHRIVVRIDQLMARCDTLETLRKEREEKLFAIHAAAINQLLDAPDGSAWNFIQQHFGELYTVKENVAELRKAILQLAVMGRLVPQNPDDPPASELLKEIKAEKQRLVKAGKIKKSKPLPPIKPEEVPYELPQEWEWVRLGDLFRVTSGKNLPKDKMQKGDIPVFGGNGITGYHNESNVIKPTVVIGRVGYYCGSIHLTPENAWITDNAFFTIYDEERLFQDFVIWLLKTINLQVNTSATAQPVISGSKIYPIPVPLPPFPEQQRIVIKIDQLMALCDTLEQQIDAANSKQSEMLNAVMARVGG